MEKAQKIQLTETDTLHACKVLDAVSEALDKVAAKPELIDQLAYELLQQFPQILSALLTITQPECRVVLYDLARKCLNVVKTCLPKK